MLLEYNPSLRFLGFRFGPCAWLSGPCPWSSSCLCGQRSSGLSTLAGVVQRGSRFPCGHFCLFLKTVATVFPFVLSGEAQVPLRINPDCALSAMFTIQFIAQSQLNVFPDPSFWSLEATKASNALHCSALNLQSDMKSSVILVMLWNASLRTSRKSHDIKEMDGTLLIPVKANDWRSWMTVWVNDIFAKLCRLKNAYGWIVVIVECLNLIAGLVTSLLVNAAGAIFPMTHLSNLIAIILGMFSKAHFDTIPILLLVNSTLVRCSKPLNAFGGISNTVISSKTISRVSEGKLQGKCITCIQRTLDFRQVQLSGHFPPELGPPVTRDRRKVKQQSKGSTLISSFMYRSQRAWNGYCKTRNNFFKCNLQNKSQGYVKRWS